MSTNEDLEGSKVEYKQGDESDVSSHYSNNLAALTNEEQIKYVQKSKVLRKLQSLAETLSRYQIEGIGIVPLTLDQRKGKQWWSPGFIWFSANVNGEQV